MSVKLSQDTFLHAVINKLGGKVTLGLKDLRDARSNKSCIQVKRLSSGVIEISSLGADQVEVKRELSTEERLQKALNDHLKNEPLAEIHT